MFEGITVLNVATQNLKGGGDAREHHRGRQGDLATLDAQGKATKLRQGRGHADPRRGAPDAGSRAHLLTRLPNLRLDSDAEPPRSSASTNEGPPRSPLPGANIPRRTGPSPPADEAIGDLVALRDEVVVVGPEHDARRDARVDRLRVRLHEGRAIGVPARNTSSPSGRETPMSVLSPWSSRRPSCDPVGTARSGIRMPPSALPSASRRMTGGGPASTSTRGWIGGANPVRSQRCACWSAALFTGTNESQLASSGRSTRPDPWSVATPSRAITASRSAGFDSRAVGDPGHLPVPEPVGVRLAHLERAPRPPTRSSRP